MKVGYFALAAISAIVFCGCSRDESASTPSPSGEDYVFNLPEGDLTELNERIDVPADGKKLRIDEMSPDDVIVCVNGYPLTKKLFDEYVVSATRGLQRNSKINPLEVHDRVEKIKRDFIRDFPHKRLLLDEAKRIKVATDDLVRSNVVATLSAGAKAAGKTLDAFMKDFPGDARLACAELAERIWINCLVAAKIPPKMKIDDEFVKAVQKQVSEDNAAARATNAVLKAAMEQWKRDIESGKTTFEDVVNEHSQVSQESKDVGGLWGDFEKADFTDRKLARRIFELYEGDISEPLEDDDAFHLVKVLEVAAAKKNAKGRIVQPEVRKIAHVYVEKVPEFIRQTDAEMFKDLSRQMQYQAMEDYAKGLETNGVNSVVYPHGIGFFYDMGDM
ncbi:MAG: peptidylprolyl isomerase [Kiritimatiellae bacterium]|nr:peptidylprolyl isomerase [Kiritimatiellia bacterium]